MRIGIISGQVRSGGGAEKQARLISEGLCRRGHEVICLDSRGLLPRAGRVATVQAAGLRRVLRRGQLDCAAIACWIDSNKLSVVYVRDVLVSGAAAAAGRRMRVPVLVALYSDPHADLLSRDLARSYVRSHELSGPARYLRDRIPEIQNVLLASWAGARFVAQTHDQARRLHNAYGAAARVIPNLADGATRSHPSLDRRRQVVWIGKPAKRPDIFCGLAGSLGSHGAISFVGIGVSSCAAQSLWVRTGMEHVSWLGDVPRERVVEELGRAMAYVHTARHEGFPNTFLEAWTCGTPVVSVHVNPDQVLQRSGGGLLCQTPQALVEGVRRLVDDDGLRRQLARNGSAYVRRFHSESVVIDAYEDLLAELITQPFSPR